MKEVGPAAVATRVEYRADPRSTIQPVTQAL
jgi:hypothetical protein